MSKLTRAVRDLNAVLSTLQISVDHVVARERLRSQEKAKLRDALTAVLPYLIEATDEVERDIRKTTGGAKRTRTTQTTLPLITPVTSPNASQLTANFVALNTCGTTTFKGETAVKVVVCTPLTHFGREPLEYTLVTGETVKISRWARGVREDRGNGFSVLPVLNRFLVKSTQTALNRLAI